jgi:hypothetical protein
MQQRKVFLIVFAGTAHAERLVAAPDAPIRAHFGAAGLLFCHVGGGTVGLLSGPMASLTRKGSALHRASEKVFFVSMFCT